MTDATSAECENCAKYKLARNSPQPIQRQKKKAKSEAKISLESENTTTLDPDYTPQSRRHAQRQNQRTAVFRATRSSGFATGKRWRGKNREKPNQRKTETTKQGKNGLWEKCVAGGLIIDNPYDRHARWRLFGATALSRGERVRWVSTPTHHNPGRMRVKEEGGWTVTNGEKRKRGKRGTEIQNTTRKGINEVQSAKV